MYTCYAYATLLTIVFIVDRKANRIFSRRDQRIRGTLLRISTNIVHDLANSGTSEVCVRACDQLYMINNRPLDLV